MIPLRDQEILRARFDEELKGPVKIDYFTQRPTPVFIPGREECALCGDVEELLSDVARLSARIELRVHDLGADRALEERYRIERVPATVVRGVINRPVVFYGAPVPELFSVLIQTIVDASGQQPELVPAVKRRLKRLKRPVRLQVFVLPAAPHCPEQALIAAEMTLGSQHVRAEIVEIAEFPRLAEEHEIRAVPTTIVDGKLTLPGFVPPEALAEQIVRTADRQTVAARSPLILGTASETSTPLPAPPKQEERGTVRPSGLIIPGR